MLKKLFNECSFTLTITPVDPVLIKSGYATVRGPDMTPVTTWRDGEQQAFLPGSSLKGVFRSHAERVIRTMKDGIVCIPYLDVHKEHGHPQAREYQDVFCGNKFRLRHGRPYNETIKNDMVYRESCPTCRLFGSTDFIGRITIGDAYLKENTAAQIERRDGVGIDRFTGGAAHRAKFELEVVSNATFETTVHIRNFEVWQFGLIAIILQDFKDELIQIGSSKSRGLGRVLGTVSKFKIAFLKSPQADAMPKNQIWGLGKFLADSQENYGTDKDDVVAVTADLPEERNGIRRYVLLEQEQRKAVFQAAIDNTIRRVQSWQVPAAMQFAHVKRG